MRLSVSFMLLVLAAGGVSAQPADPAALQRSVDELRHAHGTWTVATTFFKPDGTPTKTFQGDYEFSWAVPDKVLIGKTQTPELGMASGILFYVQPGKSQIQMNSAGGDGTLWTMTGPLGGDARSTGDIPMSDGTTQRLRFTRFNVSPDRFESRMETSADGGKTWTAGNHQVFTRKGD